jgi:hypothetical protein
LQDGRSGLAAYIARFEEARMPLIVFGVRCAKPAVTLITEDCGRFVAGLVQAGNAFIVRLCSWVRILAGRFRFHDFTRGVILRLSERIPE